MKLMSFFSLLVKDNNFVKKLRYPAILVKPMMRHYFGRIHLLTTHAWLGTYRCWYFSTV